jgi:CheY-like chemotaxis protein
MSFAERPVDLRSYRDRHQNYPHPTGAVSITFPLAQADILVADADIFARTVIADYLRSHQFRVIEAGSALEVFKILRTDIKINAVLANSALLKVHAGFSLAEEIRRNRPEIELLLVSNAVEAVDRSSEYCDAAGKLPTYARADDVLRRLHLLHERLRPSIAHESPKELVQHSI